MPVTLPPGRARVATRPLPIGSPAVANTDRNHRRGLLCCEDRRGVMRENNIDLQTDELSRDLGVALGTSFRPAVLDRDLSCSPPSEACPVKQCYIVIRSFASVAHWPRYVRLAFGIRPISRGVEEVRPRYRQTRCRSSSIRNVGDKSYGCRARYSAISSAAVRGDPSITVSMISCQTDRLRATMAGACTNCVTDMFMVLPAQIGDRWQPRSIPFDSTEPSRCLPSLRSTVQPFAGLSPWDRSELF